jgi:hypothetical protein
MKIEPLIITEPELKGSIPIFKKIQFKFSFCLQKITLLYTYVLGSTYLKRNLIQPFLFQIKTCLRKVQSQFWKKYYWRAVLCFLV